MVGGVECSGIGEPFVSKVGAWCTFKAVKGYVKGVALILSGVNALMMRLLRLS